MSRKSKKQAKISSHLEDVIDVSEPIVSCKGEEGSLGHPKVYINLQGSGPHECPYCSRHFVWKNKTREATLRIL